jgi:uncharacterized protein (TIGR02099 family)
MLSRFLKISYHFAVYAVGICVLLIAISITIIRYLLPDIGMYRDEIQAWVSRNMGYPVAIHSLEASWEGWIPNLYLKDIDMLNRQGTAVITHFDSAQISIAPLASLIHRRFIPTHLVITGFELSVTRQANGSLYLQGVRLKGRQEQNNELAEWLFRQNRIEIQQASIEWRDLEHQQNPLLLKNVSMLLRTDDDRIQIQGSAQPPPAYGNRMDFAFDARGNLLTSDWSGELYMQGDRINPDSWYKEYRLPDMDLAGGSANIKIWTTWEKARPVRVQGQLEYHDFTAMSGNRRLRVNELACRFLGERPGTRDWHLGVDVDALKTENGAWPVARITLAAEHARSGGDYTYSARFNYLKLGDLVPLLTGSSLMPDGLKISLDSLHLQGNLRDGKIIYNTNKDAARRLMYDISFDNVATRRKQDLPVIQALSGRTYGNTTNGMVVFSGDTAAFSAPAMKINNISFSEIDGKLSWNRGSGVLRVHTPLLTLSNQDITLRLAGTALINKEASPFVDAMAELTHADLEKLVQYIPYTNRFKMREWMEKAVLGGNLDSATALIRGHLSDFPFAHAGGQFKLLANVNNAVLEYSPHWPVIDNIDAEVKAGNAGLAAALNRGQMYNASFRKGTVTIPDIFNKEKHIHVEGKLYGGVHDLNLFVEDSPLAKDITLNALHKALTEGEYSLDLKLNIPFKIPGKKPSFAGNFTINDVNLVSPVTHIALNEINGNVSFTNSSISGSGLSAQFNGAPVKLDVSGIRAVQQGSSTTTITLHGRADKMFIADQIEHYLPAFPFGRQKILDLLSGNTAWDARLIYARPPGATSLQRSVVLTSDLQGLALALPPPLQKNADKKAALEIRRKLEAGAETTVNLEYGDEASGRFVFTPAADDTTHDSMLISGKVNEFPVMDWWNFLNTETTRQGEKKTTHEIKADMAIGSLSLLGQQFNNIRLAAGKENNYWHIMVGGEDVSGEMLLPETRSDDNLVTINLDRLALQKAAKEGHAPLDPATFPAIHANVGRFEYDGKDLGSLALESSPTTNGVVVESLTFKKPKMTIQGEGVWTSKYGRDKSSFTIDAHAKKIEDLLKTFGYDVTAIKNGETNLLINAEWEGSPMEFSLEKMNGHISMHLGEGQLLNVDPSSAGRLFGLLSIQALPRRLTLDFRDLFGKGLAFDKIEGNFDVNNGNAYTNDLVMKGASADVTISGRTGLSTKDYDQIVTVTPQISGSLPVAGALFGPVGIGVGTAFYLAGEMFHSLRENIDSLLRYQYTITGSWNDPVIQKIKPAEEKNG